MGLVTGNNFTENNFTTTIGFDPYTTEIPPEEDYSPNKQLALAVGSLIISIAFCLNGLYIWGKFKHGINVKLTVGILGLLAIVLFIMSIILFSCKYTFFNQISTFSSAFLLCCFCLLVIPSFSYTIYTHCCKTSNRV